MIEEQKGVCMPNDYINIAVMSKTREKVRVIARITNDKMAQVIDDAVTEYGKKFFDVATKSDRKTIVQ